jgi:hypothetical protein
VTVSGDRYHGLFTADGSMVDSVDGVWDILE